MSTDAGERDQEQMRVADGWFVIPMLSVGKLSEQNAAVQVLAGRCWRRRPLFQVIENRRRTALRLGFGGGGGHRTMGFNTGGRSAMFGRHRLSIFLGRLD